MVKRLERCLAAGGVAVFPSDTVYGLCCDPGDPVAVGRLYELKGRPPAKPAAVMWFSLGLALEALPELGPRTRDLVGRLLPGALTFLVPNPAGRFPLACGPDPATLGFRVPEVAALAGLERPLLQSSANFSGGTDARTVDEVPEPIREGADLVLDAGPLPGTPSTVVDLRGYEAAGRLAVVRAGAVPEAAVRAAARGTT